jgi:hypothetical protein
MILHGRFILKLKYGMIEIGELHWHVCWMHALT